MMENFHFLRPYWLLALLPLVGVLWRLYRARYRAGSLQRICDAALLPFLLIDRPGAQQGRLGLPLLALGGVLAIFALAGPVWERLPVPVFRNAEALVILLDLSAPMDASDIQPSRLERARYKIADVLRLRRDGQTGLVVYSGDAFTVTPLTEDAATIASQVGALSTELSPVEGRRVDLGLDAALRLLRQGGARTGHILLMTSDVDLSPALDAAQKVREAGYRLSVLGIGTEAGGPVPRGRKGLWKDANGNILVPKLNPSALRQVAEAGDGMYRTVTGDTSDIERLSSFFASDRALAGDGADSTVQLDQWIERGPWLVLVLLPIAASAFRRGGLFVLPLLVLAFPDRSEAFAWQDLWTRPDQRAARAFQGQNYDDAAHTFEDPAWRGAAWYRAGQYQEALQALKDLDTPEGWYNKGNVLARLGQFAEAIAAYRKVLEQDPGHADAKYNKELLEKYMKKKEQKKESGSGGDQQDGKQSSRQDSPQQQEEQNGKDESSPDQSAQSGQSQPQERAPDQEDQKDQKSDQASPDDASKSAPPESKAAQSGSPEDQQKDAEPPAARSEESDQGQPSRVQTETEMSEEREVQQANEQWLRRIPDDPAGLLRRKFAWQHRQRQRMNQEGEP